VKRWGVLAGWGIVLFTLTLLVVGATVMIRNLTQPYTSVMIGSTTVKASVARTDAELERGLSGVDYLGENQGKLFVFTEEGSLPMWMKDMKISLDMIWLDSDKRIVHIERNVTPGSYPTIYESSVPANYVLEVPAGTVTESRIAKDGLVSFDIP